MSPDYFGVHPELGSMAGLDGFIQEAGARGIRVLLDLVPNHSTTAAYHEENDELHLTFNFPFVLAPFEPSPMNAVVEETEALRPRGAWPAWTGSNHDALRFPIGAGTIRHWCAARS